MKHFLKMTTAVMLFAPASYGDTFTDAVVAKYRDMDFGYIEVKQGPSQVKVEAIRDATKYEVVYDKATGEIIKQETEPASAVERGLAGLEIDTEEKDFLGDDDLDDDDNDDDDDDDDDDRGRGNGRDDDDDDDDRGRGNGRDGDGDSDRGGRGGDDRGGDDSDRGGRGGGDDRDSDDDDDDDDDD